MKTRERLFTRLYKDVFPAFALHIARRAGSLEEAQDAFQEALVIYYEKVVLDGFQPRGSHRAYLFGIARNVWHQATGMHPDAMPIEGMEVADHEEQAVVSEKVISFLQTAGQKCMEILHSFYYENLTIRALSEKFGYRSERSATVQKYKCLEKVRDEVKAKSMEYADFTEEG